MWHDRRPEPARAHLAVLAGPTVLWQADLPIPAPSTTLEAIAPVDNDLPAGSRLGLHLHNHGFNGWRFVSMELRPR